MSLLSPNELVRAWEELQQNNAWLQLVETIRAQKTARELETMRNVATPDNIYDRERIRGEWAGLELVLEYAATLYEVALQDQEALAKEIQNDGKETIPPAV